MLVRSTRKLLTNCTKQFNKNLQPFIHQLTRYLVENLTE